MAFNNNPNYVMFEARFNYQPREEIDIELKTGDKCLVQKPVIDPQGWLMGLNTRSNLSGQFPGTYCQMVNFDTSPSLPPLPPKPQPKRKN